MSNKYSRVLLKLSGEALMGEQKYGINSDVLAQYAQDVLEAHKQGVEIAIVIGGGNIYRGMNEAETGIERAQGDYMGMLATVINGMALQSALEKAGMDTRLQTAIKMEQIAEPYIRRKAVRHLEKGRIVIFGAGTGNPYFTTDTAGSLRAIEIDADIILKGTRVDGVYDKDPEKYADAVKYQDLSFDNAIDQGLKIMDKTAFTLCQENDLPILVFDMNQEGNFAKVLQDPTLGTLVS